MRRGWLPLVLLAVVLPGCARVDPKPSVPPAPPDSVPAQTGPKADELVRYPSPQGYAISHPQGWAISSSLKGELTGLAPKGEDAMSVKSPGIRIFTQNYVPELPADFTPIKAEQLVGNSEWPHMAVHSAEEIAVESVSGRVSGILLKGGGESAGVSYQGLGLFLEGRGKSIRLYCTSPSDVWVTWEPVCRRIVQQFKPGDMSKPVR